MCVRVLHEELEKKKTKRGAGKMIRSSDAYRGEISSRPFVRVRSVMSPIYEVRTKELVSFGAILGMVLKFGSVTCRKHGE